MLVSEIFLSIQGESTYAGLPFMFVRLAGCTLSCGWCDTPYARGGEGAAVMTVDEIAAALASSSCRNAEITGGEPLMQQEETKDLARRLLDMGYRVLLETNGSASLAGLDERLVKIVDVKCPTSGHAGSFLVDNLNYISPEDEIKFVIGDRSDYEFAKRFMEELLQGRTGKVLFAPVKPDLDPKELADWILKDGLSVRLQVQIHKYIWGEERGR
ncbi:MAG: radical SAM protein [Deltaproteobacteria bacterium]|nr:radical SAM protein [Deltaproteobacteria bacterium]